MVGSRAARRVRRCWRDGSRCRCPTPEAVGFSIFVFAFANLIVYTDALDFALRLYMRRRHTASAGGPSDSSQNGNLSINLAALLPPSTARMVVPAIAVCDHRLGVQSRGAARRVHGGVCALPRPRVAHQRRLDGQHRAAAAPGGLAMLRRRQSIAASPARCAACSSGCPRISKPSW